MVIQGISYPSDFEAKKQMTELGRRMEEKSHVIAGEGSLSVRVGPNAVWITAEGAEKGALKQESFIRVDMNGKQSPGSRKPCLPEDLAVHLGVYAQNPALRGVIHGYPAGAVAYAALGCEAEAADYTPSIRALGRISLAPRQNAEGLARAAALVCRLDKGILAAGDGCFMWGESLIEAFHSLEALEYYVKVKKMLCAGEGAASRCGEMKVSTEPASSFGKKEVLETPAMAAAVSAEAVSAVGVKPLLEMEGLTPLIRPGDAAGFHLSARPEAVDSHLSAKPAATVQAQTANRAEMMAEVIRRSLSSMQ